MSAPRQVVAGEGARRADLAAIHVIKKALGWDDDMYRDVMFTVCRVRSSAELDHGARKRWLAHLRACQAQAAGTPAPAAKRPAWGPQLRLLWSLWQRLADAKLVNDRTRAGLQTWAGAATGVDRLEWLTLQQLDLVISQAKQWLKRGE